jgi:hypothetical protein
MTHYKMHRAKSASPTLSTKSPIRRSPRARSASPHFNYDPRHNRALKRALNASKTPRKPGNRAFFTRSKVPIVNIWMRTPAAKKSHNRGRSVVMSNANLFTRSGREARKPRNLHSTNNYIGGLMAMRNFKRNMAALGYRGRRK